MKALWSERPTLLFPLFQAVMHKSKINKIYDILDRFVVESIIKYLLCGKQQTSVPAVRVSEIL